MELWMKIVGVFAGLSTIISALTMIISLGKKPVSKAREHKDEHAILKKGIEELKEQLALLKEEVNSFYKCFLEEVSKDVAETQDKARLELLGLMEMLEKRNQIIESTINKLQKNTEKDFYTLMKNDLTVLKTLTDRGINGEVKERQAEMESHYLTRLYSDKERRKDSGD